MSKLTQVLGMDIGPSREEGEYRSLARNARNAAGGYARALAPLASRASADASRFRGGANSALDEYRALLSRRRADADRGRFVSERVAPVNAQYRQGQAALAENLRARGISPDSSAGVGGLAALEAMRGNAYAQAQMGATDQFDRERQGNLREIYDLLYGRQEDAEEDEYGLLSRIQALLSGEADAYEGLYQGERGRREARSARRQDLVGQVAQMAGGYFGGGFGGGSGGGYSTPADAERGYEYALRNNRAIDPAAERARRWGY